MKEYLQLFRDQAFNGAFVLLKRILISNILISILLSIVSILTVVPLILKGIGWTFSDLISFKEKMGDMPKNFTSPQDMKEFIEQLLGELNYGYLILAIIIAVFFSAYQYVVFFKLNDNTVRNDNTNILDALRMSLNKKIIAMLGLYFSLVILFSCIFGGYILLMVPIFKGSNILGALLGFILFFVVVVFIIRFLIAPAALVHGNMGIFESIAYSFKMITWKRAGILFLMGMVFIIAMMMVSMLISSMNMAIFGLNNSNMIAFAIGQIISSVFGAVLSAFLFCSLTSIYFRYSNDMADDNESVDEHLIS